MRFFWPVLGAFLVVACGTTPVPSSSAVPIPTSRLYAEEFTKPKQGFALLVLPVTKGYGQRPAPRDCSSTARSSPISGRASKSDCSSRRGSTLSALSLKALCRGGGSIHGRCDPCETGLAAHLGGPRRRHDHRAESLLKAQRHLNMRPVVALSRQDARTYEPWRETAK